MSSSARRASVAQSEVDSGNSRPSSPGPIEDRDRDTDYAHSVLQSTDPKYPKVKPSQAAYILRILGAHNPTASPLSNRALASTTSFSDQTQQGGTLGQNPNTGLTDCLKQFTAVEVLEGENAFACKKCWRWENPRSDGRPWRRGGEHAGEDEDEDGESVRSAVSDDGGVPIGGSSGGLDAIADVDEATEHVATLNGIDLEALHLGEPPHHEATTTTHNGYHGSIPTISQTPISPDTESPPSLAVPQKTSASLAPPLVKLNHRPANTRGISFTQHQNPEFEPAYASESDESEDEGSSIGAGSASSGGPRHVLRKAFKRYLIVHPPAILVFHLKRFQQIYGGKNFNPFGGFSTSSSFCFWFLVLFFWENLD